MCFIPRDDYDWTAEVQEETRETAGDGWTCGECGDPIPAGTVVTQIYLQENPYCRECDATRPEGCGCEPDPDDGEVTCGNSSLTRRCPDCEQVLDVIEALEKAEGCPPHTRRPWHGELFDEMFNAGEETWERYARAAVAADPALRSSRFVTEALGPPATPEPPPPPKFAPGQGVLL